MQPFVIRYEVIEVQVPTGATLTQYQFPDKPNLRNAQITAIEYIAAGNTTVSPNTGATLLSNADAEKGFLNIFKGDLQRVQNMPLLRLNPLLKNAANNINAYETMMFDRLMVSWDKCFVKFYTAPATTGCVIAFGVYYLKPEDADYKPVM
jgi:hypothetical protein